MLMIVNFHTLYLYLSLLRSSHYESIYLTGKSLTVLSTTNFNHSNSRMFNQTHALFQGILYHIMFILPLTSILTMHTSLFNFDVLHRKRQNTSSTSLVRKILLLRISFRALPTNYMHTSYTQADKAFLTVYQLLLINILIDFPSYIVASFC